MTIYRSPAAVRFVAALRKRGRQPTTTNTIERLIERNQRNVGKNTAAYLDYSRNARRPRKDRTL